MADPLILPRGDRKTFTISGLVDGVGSPASFNADDVLQWTAKGNFSAATADAFLRKTSADGGITFTPGGDSGTIHISGLDWINLPLPSDAAFVWDLQLYVHGQVADTVTLASGTGTIDADVTDNPLWVPQRSVGLHGPCTEWVTVGEVASDPRAKTSDGSPLSRSILQTQIDVASEILYRLTARLFAGVCSDVVRPTSRWYRTSYELPSQWLRWYGRGVGGVTPWNPHRYEGSGPTSELTLGAYPIREISEIRIDGAVVDPTTYRVDDLRWLVRTDPTGIGWPVSQDLTKDSRVDANTFQVAFKWGSAPPVGGVEAAKTYAIELAKGASGDECALPDRVTSLQMQGVSMALLDPMTFLDSGKVGIYSVDAWIKSVNPTGARRRSGVLSPDLPRPVRRTSILPGS